MVRLCFCCFPMLRLTVPAPVVNIFQSPAVRCRAFVPNSAFEGLFRDYSRPLVSPARIGQAFARLVAPSVPRSGAGGLGVGLLSPGF